MMEQQYKELLQEYPFLIQIVRTIENISRIDKRNWDNLIEEDFTKCKRISIILKENKLI
jgi:hypothetical protein